MTMRRAGFGFELDPARIESQTPLGDELVA